MAGWVISLVAIGVVFIPMAAFYVRLVFNPSPGVLGAMVGFQGSSGICLMVLVAILASGRYWLPAILSAVSGILLVVIAMRGQRNLNALLEGLPEPEYSDELTEPQ